MVDACASSLKYFCFSLKLNVNCCCSVCGLQILCCNLVEMLACNPQSQALYFEFN
uniref:Uncharacterized protein n=1 Tax=Arundo donax TaxID=35708 RepID=A0A0A9D1J9_ARUDO